MKNLFDFAAKELSQDAFISWLVSNYDNSENVELKKIAYDFINFISKKNYNYKNNEIKHLNVLQQANNMDVIIDIWESDRDFSNKYSSDFVIVIEDKTTSLAHDNQLYDYGKIIDSWTKWDNDKQKKESVRVFYKTNKLSDKDNEELKKDKKWIPYSIVEINDFFKDIKTNDEIVNFYIEHVKKIHEDINVLNKNAKEWNFFNFYYFVNKIIRKEYIEKKIFNKKEYEWGYQGKYASTGFYLETNYKSGESNRNNTICLEIFFRPESNSFNATIHPEYYYHDKNSSWKNIKKVEYAEENEKNDLFREKISNILKESNSKYFKPYSSKQCIGTSKKDIERTNDYNKLVDDFHEMIDDFIDIFKDKIVKL